MTMFIGSIYQAKYIKRFEGVVPTLLKSCVECVRSSETAGETALTALTEFTEGHSSLVKPHFEDFVTLFTQVINTEALQDSIREKGKRQTAGTLR